MGRQFQVLSMYTLLAVIRQQRAGVHLESLSWLPELKGTRWIERGANTYSLIYCVVKWEGKVGAKVE